MTVALSPTTTVPLPDRYRDESDYSFSDPTTGRQVTVRYGIVVPSTQGEHDERLVAGFDDLQVAATRYGERMEQVFGATIKDRKDSKEERQVEIVLRYPHDSAAGELTETEERTAFRLFKGAGGVQISHFAAVQDSGAEKDYRRLLDTIKPAKDAKLSTGRMLLALPSSSRTRRVGPIVFNLDENYLNPRRFRVANDQGDVVLMLDFESSVKLQEDDEFEEPPDDEGYEVVYNNGEPTFCKIGEFSAAMINEVKMADGTVVWGMGRAVAPHSLKRPQAFAQQTRIPTNGKTAVVALPEAEPSKETQELFNNICELLK